jgi:hypothetical protein
MKRLVIITTFCCLIGVSLYAQKAIFYNEGPIMYVIDYYSFEGQKLFDESNPVCEINDSIFLSFLDEKIESVERCTEEGECFDASNKPTAMIQVVYINNAYCYYTLNVGPMWYEDLKNTLTIDGKSYIPDKELQDVITEIVKFCVINKKSPTNAQLHDIMAGQLKTDAPFWPWL